MTTLQQEDVIHIIATINNVNGEDKMQEGVTQSEKNILWGREELTDLIPHVQGLCRLRKKFSVLESDNIYTQFENKYFSKHYDEYCTALKTGTVKEYDKHKTKVWNEYVRRVTYRGKNGIRTI